MARAGTVEVVARRATVSQADYQKAAAERDLPLIQQVIERGQRQGRDVSHWTALLMKVKRYLHLPYREE